MPRLRSPQSLTGHRHRPSHLQQGNPPRLPLPRNPLQSNVRRWPAPSDRSPWRSCWSRRYRNQGQRIAFRMPWRRSMPDRLGHPLPGYHHQERWRPGLTQPCLNPVLSIQPPTHQRCCHRQRRNYLTSPGSRQRWTNCRSQRSAARRTCCCRLSLAHLLRSQPRQHWESLHRPRSQPSCFPLPCRHRRHSPAPEPGCPCP